MPLSCTHLNCLHVGIISLACVRLFRYSRVRERTAFPLITAILFCFVLLTGAKPPTVRAALMAVVALCECLY
jgi:predicted membrane metal-binding protein